MSRPRFLPTEEQRRMVKSMSAYGITNEGIAKVLGLQSPETLQKHFLQELALGAVEAKAQIARTLYQMAKFGKRRNAMQQVLAAVSPRSGRKPQRN